MSGNSNLLLSASCLRHKAFAWFTDVTQVKDPDVLAEYEVLLDDQEKRRHAAFHFADDRHLYLVAHALLRTSLSRFADVQPGEWRISSDESGRPEVAAEQCPDDRIRFNLSHTRGLAACVVTANVDIGIDVERLDRRCDMEAIAQRYFSLPERRALMALPVKERPTRFLEYWTLKEAYVKACGLGLAIPLDSFFFYRDEQMVWRIGFDRDDDPNKWSFVCVRPTPDHVLSIAIHDPDASEYEVNISEAWAGRLTDPSNS
jgi:4'-phosphopantetheinyl transferase